MGSKSIDSGTQKAASTAAQADSSTQAANAAKAQTNANAQYAGLNANLAPSANPASLTSPTLNSTYKNAYTTTAGQNAQAAQQATTSAIQQQDNRGMGAAPAGFAADQARQAYQNQANSNATAYTTDALQQQADAINNYQYANTQIGNEAANQQNAATSNLSNASGTNTSLYGTASQQKQSSLGTVLGAAGGLAGAAATAYAGRG